MGFRLKPEMGPVSTNGVNVGRRGARRWGNTNSWGCVQETEGWFSWLEHLGWEREGWKERLRQRSLKAGVRSLYLILRAVGSWRKSRHRVADLQFRRSLDADRLPEILPRPVSWAGDLSTHCSTGVSHVQSVSRVSRSSTNRDSLLFLRNHTFTHSLDQTLKKASDHP